MTRQLMTLPQLLEARPWLTERFVRTLVAERRIPFHKVGRKLIFDLSDVDALVEAGRVEAR
jgi:excisionase family DNA binding protein